jgi:hypothetical protein
MHPSLTRAGKCNLLPEGTWKVQSATIFFCISPSATFEKVTVDEVAEIMRCLYTESFPEQI